MLDRLIVALLLVIAGYLGYRALIRAQLRRAGISAPRDPLLSALQPGVPAILYFTTPTCAPCRTQQMPALAAVQADLGDSVQIIHVDATERPADADRWGVLSAPTTFIIDAQGRPVAVNHGVADADKLKRQIDAARIA